jgi:predicted esterase
MADLCFRVMYLHGFDNTPRTGIGAALAEALGPGFVVEEPGGLIALPSGGRAWWHEDFGILAWDQLRKQLDAFEEHEDLPTLLCAFSQGSSAALAWLTHPKRATAIHGAVLVSPFLVDVVEDYLRGPNTDLPTIAPLQFVTFEDDAVVDPMHSKRTARLLRTRSIEVESVELRGGHLVTDDAIELMATLLRESTVS